MVRGSYVKGTFFVGTNLSEIIIIFPFWWLSYNKHSMSLKAKMAS